ncbi:MAG: hypothetical protein FWF35_02020 [Elusimicrobia bacterium]|nr:hypothetical protein [Elusimicrobiota bacterium]
MAEDTNKKDSFTFSDKIKDTKPAPVPFTKRFSASKVGSDGKPKKTFFERTKRDAPFFIAALIVLLLLPFFIKFTGTGADESDIIVRNPYEPVTDAGSAYDQCLDENGQLIDGCVAGASGRDSIDMLRDAIAQGEPAPEAASLTYTPTPSVSSPESRSAYTDLRSSAPSGMGRAMAVRQPTNIGTLRPGEAARAGGRVNPGFGPVAASAAQTGPNAPAKPSKPITLQPLTGASRLGRSVTGEAALAEAQRSLGAMGKSNAMQALMDAQLGRPTVGPGGGLGAGRVGGGGGGSGLNNKWSYQGQKPWWWDMMEKRAQMKWEFWFKLWSDPLKKFVDSFGFAMACCLISGQDDCSVGKFWGQAAKDASDGTCGDNTGTNWDPSAHKGQRFPKTKEECCCVVFAGGSDCNKDGGPYSACMGKKDGDIPFSKPNDKTDAVGPWKQRTSCWGYHSGAKAAISKTCDGWNVSFEPNKKVKGDIYHYVVVRSKDTSSNQNLLCGNLPAEKYKTDWTGDAAQDTSFGGVAQAQSKADAKCKAAVKTFNDAKDALDKGNMAGTEAANKAQAVPGAGTPAGDCIVRIEGLDQRITDAEKYANSCWGDRKRSEAECKTLDANLAALKDSRDKENKKCDQENAKQKKEEQAAAAAQGRPAVIAYTGGKGTAGLQDALNRAAKDVDDNCKCDDVAQASMSANFAYCKGKSTGFDNNIAQDDCVIYVQSGKEFNVDVMREALVKNFIPSIYDCAPDGTNPVQGQRTCRDVLAYIHVKYIGAIATDKPIAQAVSVIGAATAPKGKGEKDFEYPYPKPNATAKQSGPVPQTVNVLTWSQFNKNYQGTRSDMCEVDKPLGEKGKVPEAAPTGVAVTDVVDESFAPKAVDSNTFKADDYHLVMDIIDGKLYAAAKMPDKRYTFKSSAGGGIDIQCSPAPIVAVSSCCKDMEGTTLKKLNLAIRGGIHGDYDITSLAQDTNNADKIKCACGTDIANIKQCKAPPPPQKQLDPYQCSQNSSFQDILNKDIDVETLRQLKVTCGHCYEVIVNYIAAQTGMDSEKIDQSIQARTFKQQTVSLSLYLKAIRNNPQVRATEGDNGPIPGELVCAFATQVMKALPQKDMMNHPVRGLVGFISAKWSSMFGYPLPAGDKFFPLQGMANKTPKSSDEIWTCLDRDPSSRACNNFKYTCDFFKGTIVNEKDFQYYLDAFCQHQYKNTGNTTGKTGQAGGTEGFCQVVKNPVTGLDECATT